MPPPALSDQNPARPSQYSRVIAGPASITLSTLVRCNEETVRDANAQCILAGLHVHPEAIPPEIQHDDPPKIGRFTECIQHISRNYGRLPFGSLVLPPHVFIGLRG
jgi:hypothetical protein